MQAQDFNELYNQRVNKKVTPTELFECKDITNKEIRSLFNYYLCTLKRVSKRLDI